ncbi:hypothetical protein [Brevundimonas subvibrioides]|uniref:Uncharacterized protein n=1 Tax=Brevundimonas subvibrioides (strain ATCC 15264 / DSM 4735 / LMG 14903 / NBRC 16000 / CB 81) TaxID=633149 RepID=D9QHR6_BRESC|nr:hypothetical protein [Brevundimonas subvibrioides]ADK99341.1 hypothetical protein Bresu_0026 [Brevundimonas subvibrioides ATCC 15264]
MRRFLIWSALAVVIGLTIAGGGYWAYWNFYARFQPVTVARNQAEIQRLLDESSWVSEGGGGQPLYIIGYRDSAASQRYEREETEKLRAGGVEVRVVVFARPDREGQALSTGAERATVAELWLSRDWSLYQRWTATPAANWTAAGIPAADGNLARSAVVDASRAFVEKLTDLLRDAGVPTGYPLVIWRDREGFMKACACSDARSWAFIRDDFDAPDAVAPTGLDEPGDPVPPGVPGPAAPGSLPYPTLPGIPPVDGQVAPGQPVPPAGAPGAPATPPRATPTRPSQPTAPPQPTQQEDTTFF